MTRQELINTIGRLFVDKSFRDDFNNNVEKTVSDVNGLSDEEKKFLREMSTKIADCTKDLDVEYQGENKTRR